MYRKQFVIGRKWKVNGVPISFARIAQFTCDTANCFPMNTSLEITQYSVQMNYWTSSFNYYDIGGDVRLCIISVLTLTVSVYSFDSQRQRHIDVASMTSYVCLCHGILCYTHVRCVELGKVVICRWLWRVRDGKTTTVFSWRLDNGVHKTISTHRHTSYVAPHTHTQSVYLHNQLYNVICMLNYKLNNWTICQLE